jgi:hypothetical protein
MPLSLKPVNRPEGASQSFRDLPSTFSESSILLCLDLQVSGWDILHAAKSAES